MTTDDTTPEVEVDPGPGPLRVPTTYVHGVHLVQLVTLRQGKLAARGRYHLAQHGPTALCGVSFALDRVNRRDLYTSELVHPELGIDVCPDCIEQLGRLHPEVADLDVPGSVVTFPDPDGDTPSGLGGVRVEA